MHRSSSDEQQSVESKVLDWLNRTQKLTLVSDRLPLPDGGYVQIDGLDEAGCVACEIYAHIGQLKGSQPDKVASDILKLVLVEKLRGDSWRKILCFADENAAKKLKGRSWLAKTVREFGVEVLVAEIEEDDRRSVKEAQKRQQMVNRDG